MHSPKSLVPDGALRHYIVRCAHFLVVGNSLVFFWGMALKEPLNKPESSAIRLLLPLSLLDFPKALRVSRGLVQRFLNAAEVNVPQM